MDDDDEILASSSPGFWVPSSIGFRKSLFGAYRLRENWTPLTLGRRRSPG
jgi:hypothetical protein